MQTYSLETAQAMSVCWQVEQLQETLSQMRVTLEKSRIKKRMACVECAMARMQLFGSIQGHTVVSHSVPFTFVHPSMLP